MTSEKKNVFLYLSITITRVKPVLYISTFTTHRLSCSHRFRCLHKWRKRRLKCRNHNCSFEKDYSGISNTDADIPLTRVLRTADVFQSQHVTRAQIMRRATIARTIVIVWPATQVRRFVRRRQSAVLIVRFFVQDLILYTYLNTIPAELYRGGCVYT